jgi:hypothetical protein
MNKFTKQEVIIINSLLKYLKKGYFSELDKCQYPAPNAIDPKEIKRIYELLQSKFEL